MLRLNNCATISSRIEISAIRATAKQFHQCITWPQGDAAQSWRSRCSAENSGERTRLACWFWRLAKTNFVNDPSTLMVLRSALN